MPTRIFPPTHQRSRGHGKSKHESHPYLDGFSICTQSTSKLFSTAGWSSLVARQAHNLKAAGSNPAPATRFLPTAVAYRVYVIQNRPGKFYIGLTDNVARRLQQHNSGESRWTKGRGPWVIVWHSEELSLSEARKLENGLKRQERGNGFYAVTGLDRGHS